MRAPSGAFFGSVFGRGGLSDGFRARETKLAPVLAEDTIQAVRDQVSVKAVIGERIKLEQRGRSLVGLCPFHKEKSPSFHVNEERGFYYCFGCHASGDAIRFVQETDGLGFSDAVRELAQRFGIEIVETRGTADRARDDAVRRQRDELLDATEIAAKFFEQCLLQHPLGHHAREEIERRGLQLSQKGSGARDPTLAAFRVGYAPYGWDALAVHLKSQGAGLKAAEAVGLVGARKQGAGFYDRFRHRLMFGIVDLRGKVVAFSGRMLGEPDAAELGRLGLSPLGDGKEGVAKYMNSPESSIYKKRELVFGLYQARDAIRHSNDCVLVEGNFDVVSLHARGIANVVAPLGTAFTREQAAQIRRYSAGVTLLFDGDSAGLRATRASREPCKEEGLSVRVARLPSGTDPDDFVRNRGPEGLVSCLRNAQGMLEFLIEDTLSEGIASGDAAARGRKIQEVLDLVRAEQDPTVRALAQTHADMVARRLGITDQRVIQALSREVRSAATLPQSPETRSELVLPPERARSRGRADAVEAAILGVLVEHPALLGDDDVRARLTHVGGALALAVVALRRHRDALIDNLDAFGALKGVVASRLAAPEVEDAELARNLLLDNLMRLSRSSEQYGKEEALRELRQAAATGNIDAERELLEKAREAALEREKLRQRIKR
jgi:DNA primase